MKRWKLFTLATLFFSATSVFGQEINITGTVTSRETGEPLPGANIVVEGTNLGTATDAQGNFRLRLPNTSEATLEVRFIGYETEEVTVTPETNVLDIALEEDVLKVSEIVVTGLATSVKRRNLAHAVGTVSAEELEPAPAQTLERALTGKLAGIRVSQNTGAPGGGIDVNLRGVSTIIGSTQPLYVVDGVIINNEAIQSGIDLVSEATVAGSARPQGQPTNRIADLNPNDIESIEVLKGASAAAIYGSKATNGVVIINTKRGTIGKTRIDVTQHIGFSRILNKIGTRRFTEETAQERFGDTGVELFRANGGRFIDQEEVLFGEEGFVHETNIGVRGGNERTQFYVSGLVQDEDGIVKNTGYQKYSGKANVEHRISERLQLSVFSTFGRSESQRSITGNDNTNTTLGFSLGFTPSFIDLVNPAPEGNLEAGPTGFSVHPFNPSNPAETIAFLDNREVVYRTLGSFRLLWNAFRTAEHNLDFILQGGVDFYSAEHRVFSPNDLQFERVKDLPGEAINGETENTNSNMYFNVAHSYNAPSNILFRTSAGVQFENHNLNNVLVNSIGLVKTQQNVDQATSVDVFQTKEIQRERGFYVQEEVNLQERIFLTAGVRGDASSANGDTDKFFLFPKFSGSLRLSEFGFWQGLSGLASEFKLRAAYGETGNLPPAEAKFTNLAPSNVGGNSGLLPAGRRGLEDIEPERTKEIELGFDATILSERGALEFTYYRQNISNLIIEQDLPPSSGFTSEILNAGEMRTTGVEVSLGLTPIRSETVNWTSRVNFYTTDSEITELDVDPFNIGGFATFLGTYRIEEGWSPTTIVGSEMETLPDGTVQHKTLGNATPDFQLSLNNNLTFGNFELRFLWDWQQGGDVINLGKLIMDLGGTSPDWDEIGTFIVDGEPVEMRKGQGRLTVLGTQTAPYVEDGTYLKLRELSLSYSFPQSVVSSWSGGQLSYLRVGVSGRNLLMFTGYDGYDPEVSQFGNVAIGRNVDTLPFPSSRTFYFNISFGI